MITITQTPNAHNSVYRPIIFKCTSNAVATDLRVSCELYVLGSKVVTLWSEAIDGIFEFDVSSLLHSFLEFTVLNGGIGVYDLSGNVLPFYVVLTEFYNNDIGLLTAYHSRTSSIYKANSLNLDFYRSNFWDYILGSYDSKFLTNAPKATKIKPYDKPQLFFITDTEDVVVNVEQTLPSGSNTNSIYTKTLTNGFGGFLLEVANSSSVRVDVWIEDVNEERLSEVRQFVLDHSGCQVYRIEWLNVLGGIDGFNFTGKDAIESTTEQSQITRYVVANHEADYHKTINYQTNTVESVQVYSEFVNQATAKWLSEIQQSKRVWWIDNGFRKAINVTSSSQTMKQGTNLVQVSLSFDMMPFENY